MHRGGLAVAVAAVLAGCGSVVGPATPTETVTPAPVPTSTHTPASVGPPPGVTADGIEDLDVLLAGHRSVVADTSYVWSATHREAYVARAGPPLVSQNRSVVSGGDGAYRRYMSAISPEGGRTLEYVLDYEQYGDGDVVYARWRQPDEPTPTFSRSDDPAPPTQLGIPLLEIRRYLALDEGTVSRIDVGERRHHVIRGTQSVVDRYGPVESFQARALVRADGLIRRLNVTFVTTYRGQSSKIRYTSVYSRLGTATVTPPEWLAEARERTGAG